MNPSISQRVTIHDKHHLQLLTVLGESDVHPESSFDVLPGEAPNTFWTMGPNTLVLWDALTATPRHRLILQSEDTDRLAGVSSEGLCLVRNDQLQLITNPSSNALTTILCTRQNFVTGHPHWISHLSQDRAVVRDTRSTRTPQILGAYSRYGCIAIAPATNRVFVADGSETKFERKSIDVWTLRTDSQNVERLTLDQSISVQQHVLALRAHNTSDLFILTQHEGPSLALERRDVESKTVVWKASIPGFSILSSHTIPMSPCGGFLTLQTRDRNGIQWVVVNAQTGQIAHTIALPNLFSLVLVGERASWIAGIPKRGYPWIYHTESRSSVCAGEGHIASVSQVFWLNDNSLVASRAYGDSLLRLWDVSKNECINTFETPFTTQQVVFLPDRRHFAILNDPDWAGYRSMTLSIVDTFDGQSHATHRVPYGRGIGLASSHDGETFAWTLNPRSGGGTRPLTFWTPRTNNTHSVHYFISEDRSKQGSRQIAFSNDQQSVFTYGEGGPLYQIECADGHLRAVIPLPTRAPGCWTPRTTHVIVPLDDEKVACCDLNSHQELWSRPDRGIPLAASQTLCVVSDKHSFRLYRISNGMRDNEVLFEDKEHLVQCAAFSDDGSRLAMGMEDGSVMIFEVTE